MAIPTRGLLEGLLKSKSEAHLEQYIQVRKQAEAVHSGAVPGYCCLFGPSHWDNVAHLIARLLPEKLAASLTASEVLLLLAATCLHDVLAGTAPPTEDPRERYRFLTEPSSDPWGLTARQGQILRRICSSIIGSARDFSRYTHEFAFIGRDAVNVHLLAALLRLAEVLDVEYTSHVPPAVQSDLPPEQWAHWRREYGATMGLIDGREWILRIDVTTADPARQELLASDFQALAQQELEEVRAILLTSGIAYRRIDLNLIHRKLAPFESEDKALSRRALSWKQHQQPYKFLDPFNPTDAALFFARDDDALRVLGRVLSHRLCVLFGELGVGKTSLIQAGIMPRLIEEGFLPLYARCFDDPSRSIKNAARPFFKEASPTLDSEVSLAECLLQLHAETGQDIVVFLDQCQEIFTRLGSATRHEFARDLVECLGADGEHLYFVLSLREDFLPRMDELRRTLPSILTQLHKLERFTPEQAREAIVRPISKFRCSFEDVLVTRLTEDLYHEGIRPIELQIVCDELWNALEAGDRTIRLEMYRQRGGASRILENYLDQRLRRLGLFRQSQGRAVLVEMMTSFQTKALLRSSEIAVSLGLEETAVQRLLEDLQQLHLVRAVDYEGESFYELRHDYLAERLRQWLSEAELKIKDIHELLRREVNNWQQFQLLMDVDKMALIDPYRRRLKLTGEALELLIRSAVAHHFELPYWMGRIGELPPPAQATLFEELVQHESSEVRELALGALKRLNPEALVRPLVETVRETTDVEVREVTLEALTEIDRELVKALDSQEEETRREVVYALGQIGSERALQPLVEAAQDDSDPVRTEAVSALEEIDSRRGADLLLRELRTGTEESRWRAAEALGQLGRREEVRERLRRFERIRSPSPQMWYALGRAYLESKQLDSAQEVLDRLLREFPAEARHPLVQEAQATLASLRERAARGDFRWSMFRKDATGIACSQTSLALPLELKWRMETKGLVRSSPTVFDGFVYIGSEDHQLYAADSETGHVVWTFTTNGRVKGATAVSGERVYVGSEDGRVYAVEIRTGQESWRHNCEAPVESSPCIGPQLLYVSALDGRLWALDSASGTVLWQYESGATDLRTTPALAEGSLYVGTAAGTVVALDALTGTVRWQRGVGGGNISSPTLAQGSLYVVSQAGHLHALTPKEGRIIWTASVEAELQSSPTFAQGKLILGGQDGGAYAFDAATGELQWRTDLGGPVEVAPAIAGDLVFLGSHSGSLYALDLLQGEVRWQHHTGYGIFSSAAIADGRLYVGLSYYYLCAFGPVA